VVTGRGLLLDRGPGTTRRQSVYRTGDLGRLRPDGLIDLVGRADRQISIKGHRVELDGVEAVLRTVPGVRDAHVAVTPDGSELRAWWVGSAVTAEDLLEAARSRLTGPSVPGRLHQVPALPLTDRGKIDTRALLAEPYPSPLSTTPEPDTAGRWTGRLLDQVLLLATQQLNGRELAADDDFFAAGLTSLGLLQLHQALRRSPQLDGDVIELADLFRFPTARRLVDHLNQVESSLGAGAPKRARTRPSRSPQQSADDELRLRRAARSRMATYRQRSDES
jgi:aryl carrier-like protein